MTTSQPMQLGMIGLGRMGANIVRRIMRDGHTAVVYDRDPAAVAALFEAVRETFGGLDAAFINLWRHNRGLQD